jgi:hypothetical protein
LLESREVGIDYGQQVAGMSRLDLRRRQRGGRNRPRGGSCRRLAMVPSEKRPAAGAAPEAEGHVEKLKNNVATR